MSTRSTYDKRHPDDHYIDEVRIVTRERYKMSGLSGDEWRFSLVVQLYRKGHRLYERAFNGNPQMVAGFVPWVMVNASESGDMQLLEDTTLCFQPGCPDLAVSEYELKEEFSPQGQKLDPSETQYSAHRRRFCAKHLRRGDCGREDSDENYTVISGPGPDGADMRNANVTVSGRVDVRVSNVDEIPTAIEAALKAHKKDSN